MLLELVMYILPLLAIVLGGIMFFRRITTKYRIILLLATFLLTRYLLISSQAWDLRFAQERIDLGIQQHPLFYLILSVVAGLIAVWYYAYPFELNRYIVWKKRTYLGATASAICGVAVMLVPFLMVYPADKLQLGLLQKELLWLSFLSFVVLGKTLEVFIFQGYLQGYLKERYSSGSAILFTAFLFSICHIFHMAFVGQFVVWLLLYGILLGAVLACLTHFYGIYSAILSHSLFYIIWVSIL